MKAAIMKEYGDFDVLKYEEVKTPEVKEGYVLIKILAAGVNRFDHYLREGSVTKELPLPLVLGADASGVIEAVGKGVSNFKKGDKVIPLPGYPLKSEDDNVHPMASAASFAPVGMMGWGTYAQYMTMPAKWVVEDKTHLKPEEIAALPMVIMTTVRAVKVVGEVKKGDHVLVHAGAGGTGSMAIQVAKALGAKVATTVRHEDKVKIAKEAGADLVINSSKENFVEAVKKWTDGKGADVIIDGLGGSVFPETINALRPLGVLVVYGFVAGTKVSFDIRDFFFAQKQIRGTMMGDPADLEWGLDQLAQGKIKPIVGKTMPLSQANKAHEMIAHDENLGKIILLPWKE